MDNQRMVLNYTAPDLKKLEMVFEAANEGYFYMTLEGSTKYFNRSFYSSYDFDLDKNRLDDWISIIHPEDRKTFLERVKAHFEGVDCTSISEYRVINKNGEVRWLESLGKVISEVDCQSGVAMVGYHKDITNRKEEENSIKQLAYYDSLTKTYNLNFINKCIENLLLTNNHGVFIQIDMNNLKKVNSSFGYRFADEYICMVSDRIKSCLPSYAVTARNYGDVFCVLVSDRDIFDINELIKKIEETISKPYNIMDRYILTKPLISIFPITEIHQSVDYILHQAEHVIEYMKMKQQFGVMLYDSKIADYYTRLLKIEEYLYRAINRNEMYVNFQPVVETFSGKIIGFETLLRWENDELGWIGPDEFISIAEKTHMINALGDFVLTKACEFSAKLETLNADLSISVNISPVQLNSDNYVNRTLTIIKDSGANLERLVFEVTESSTLEEETSIIERLKLLNTAGIRLAIDDFGTGYSSLKSILSLPISFIKIDKSIIQEIFSNKEAFSLVKMLSHYSYDVNYKVIAEGVETEEIRDLLKVLNVDRAQGYLFSKPMDEKHALKLIVGE